MGEIRKEVIVENDEGLHARPAAMLVQSLRDLQCQVWLTNESGERVDAKSILGVMMLAAERGARLEVHTIGTDAEKALEVIESILGEGN